ncbi:class III extradiol dioxygenase subunit B-like domain-containing protein [Luedemannella helvata]|uniref:Class III extradiol dioxygenase subunit B-like domain-containing protein n=1 Tax=Luedemannella helvata TaxID=349315 RepID=A0ABN2L6B4_9ACTN
MPLVAAALCPHPPVLVPEVAAGAAGELDALRAACGTAVATLADAALDRLVVLGGGDRTAAFDATCAATFEPWGVPLRVRPGTGEAPPRLPLSLTVAAWLLDRYFHPGRPVEIEFRTVAADASPAECAALARALRAPDSWGLLVMGDGSACRGEKSPGYADPRAEGFDTAVARALADVDTGALLALDPVTAAELLVAGRAPWQVLANATLDSGGVADVGAGPADGSWRGELLAHEAPYGVAYFVATWRSA